MHWAKLGGFLMAAAILTGAFGAHALKGRIGEGAMDVYRTAVLYHMVHALGLFAVAWLYSYTGDSKVTVAGVLFVAGVVLFSGSLYALSLTGTRWLGAVTPLGGVCFVLGWLFLAFAKFKV